MAGRLQLRRGTTLQNEAFTGAVGEPTLDTETGLIHIHDGQTQGGKEFIDPVVAFQVPTADNNYTWYRLYASGWVEQGGQASVSQSASTTVSLPITMANTTFYVNFNTTDTADGASVSRSTRITSASQIELRLGYGSNLTRNGVWEVKGMAAQGA